MRPVLSGKNVDISPSVKLGFEGYKYSNMLTLWYHFKLQMALHFNEEKLTFVQAMPSGPNDETKIPLNAFR